MNGLDGVTARQLSDLIGDVYDCALEPERWPSTCRTVADLCESTGGGICVHDLKQVRNDQLFVFGYEPKFLEALGSQFAESPMAAADVVSNVGDVNSLAREPRQLLESRFYREVLEPYGLRDIIWFPALRTGGRMASLHASRGEKGPFYHQRDVELFRLISPHVCRALAISDALDIRALRSQMLEKTLDGLSAGVFLTARDGHVVYMNAAAERQVREGRAVCIAHNRLSAVLPEARAALESHIDAATQAASPAAWRDHSVAIPDGMGAGRGYVATLLPIESGERSGILAPFAASVAVFVQDPIQVPLMPGEAFARLHGLTGAELRVLLALSQGLGGMESAEMLGVSEPTVRTHLQHIFSKTGTTKQADLLLLLSRSTPPVRAVN
ncbi:DNA-binding transcriptional regulator, CsgD family [Ralstonia sp. 25mfcol4.1]|uniref:helix-turn-helix transcriptional regulator n=1 Tax=Burkholderiaceae TaxID=119060 RepID=UPI0008857FD5|nr:LuxR C-terminal-related transcriptional regulator [Ralstonia sp. 25mfcol4.1]SDP18371.1 DNA-binding transcriptional regulator, CsgD family [Ralstonia sp. 25mfcol4.1]